MLMGHINRGYLINRSAVRLQPSHRVLFSKGDIMKMYTKEEIRMDLITMGFPYPENKFRTLKQVLVRAVNMGVVPGKREEDTCSPGAKEYTFCPRDIGWAAFNLERKGLDKDHQHSRGKKHRGSVIQEVEHELQLWARDKIWYSTDRGRREFTNIGELQKIERLLKKKARYVFKLDLDRIEVQRWNNTSKNYMTHNIVMKNARINCTSFGGKVLKYDFETPQHAILWAEVHLMIKL